MHRARPQKITHAHEGPPQHRDRICQPAVTGFSGKNESRIIFGHAVQYLFAVLQGNYFHINLLSEPQVVLQS
jgi:hypothetical protein